MSAVKFPKLAGVLGLLALALAFAPALADDVPVAVAANFAAPMKEIAAAFERKTGHKVLLSSGSTGKLSEQIRNGAPFLVFLSADDRAPARLEGDGLAVPGTRFTYATGRLALWSSRPGFVDGRGEVLRLGAFRHVAVANPKLAPYGVAAIEAMTKLGVLAGVESRIVLGESVGQTLQFVASGNAELGFVALSQVTKDGRLVEGSMWLVPADLHSPIRQDAVLLATGRGRPAAEALLGFLRGDEALAIIGSFGYGR
jgi:molybdate transport system substrate-binding protein